MLRFWKSLELRHAAVRLTQEQLVLTVAERDVYLSHVCSRVVCVVTFQTTALADEAQRVVANFLSSVYVCRCICDFVSQKPNNSVALLLTALIGSCLVVYTKDVVRLGHRARRRVTKVVGVQVGPHGKPALCFRKERR